MRVCIISPGFAPVPPNGPGAVERLLFDLSESLVRQNLCEVHLIDVRSTDRAKTNDKIVYHLIQSDGSKKSFVGHLTSGLRYGILASWTLYREHKKTPFDIVHAHNQYSGLFCLLMCRLLKIPFVYTSHNQELVDDAFAKRLRHAVSSLIIRNANFVTVQTPTIASIYRTKYHSKVKVKQIYLGVDTSLNKKINYQRDPNLIICVARIVKRKRQDTLIDAMASVVKTFPKARMFLVGPIDDKEYYASLVQKIKDLKLQYSVHFTGPISNRRLYNLYRKASVFCLASDNEHQGLVVLESMIFGTPIVVSDIGPFTDVVRQGKDVALVCKMGDHNAFAVSIKKLLASASRRRKYGQNGFNFVRKEFSWDSMAKKTFAFYQEVANETPYPV
jgi:glycosyltransferase involved in cell wall biosynthesis